MSKTSRLATSVTELLQWLPADHVAEVAHSRDPNGREVLTLEGMNVVILHKDDPFRKTDPVSRYPDPWSQRQLILSSGAPGLGDFRVYLTEPPAIAEQEELLIRGYFAKHQRLSRGVVLEVG